MQLIIRQALIASPDSPDHGQIRDILVEGDTIQQVAPHISTQADHEIKADGLTISPGWIDPFCHFCDPGHEHRETLASGAATAAAGGFTRVFLLPNTQPIADNKAAIEYTLSKSNTLPTLLHPLGAITKGCQGKDLAEMYDMHHSGAIAFTDGLTAVQQPGLLLKALQYVKAFSGVVIQLPVDKSIGAHGLMNEGIISTRMGLPGIPALAEEIMVKRDLDLLRYTQSQLHITGITTEKSLNLIRDAKQEGWKVTCSVTPFHLLFCDEDLQQYNTNLKVFPPLRNSSDRAALREGILDGTIDCISTHHLPQHSDQKQCEFEYAAPGMIGLQTCFPILQHIFPELPLERLIALLSTNSRNLFQVPLPSIQQGQPAEFTLFSREGTTTLTPSNNKSLSSNSPLFNQTLPGKVVGTMVRGSFHLNQTV
ncbi:MAG: dihydroorotase [Chitinophagaceae bacterium]|nr:dihydroorotase [Chitinophagaceae bacterium]